MKKYKIIFCCSIFLSITILIFGFYKNANQTPEIIPAGQFVDCIYTPVDLATQIYLL
jgi:hypothetical protein